MKTTTGQDMTVFRLLERAANAGKECPSNNDIADALGCASCSCGPRVMNRLEAAGLISVQRGGQSRVVTICATGKRTAGDVGAVHWRFRPENKHRRHEQSVSPLRARARLEQEPEPLMLRVERDPCPRCGTRADIGCAHHAVVPA